MKNHIITFAVTFYLIFSGDIAVSQGFLKADGKQIVNEKGENVLLRGIGLGGWMLQEPYMFQLSEVAGTQTEIKSKISELIGQKNCDEFYRSEEHTSELQSRQYLVCRLLLEKKNK